MEEDELIKEAEEALRELENKKPHHHADKIKVHDATKRNPFSYLLVLVLLLIIIMMAIPYYGIKLDPEPKNIPELSEVTPYGVTMLINDTPGISGSARSDMLKLIMPSHQSIRNMAARIATASCRDSEICYAKALFYFVRDEFSYVGDPPSNNYLESPFETIYSGGADCDGLAIMLANLELAVGIPTRLAFIPGHVYVQVKIDGAPKKYKEKDGWISLDPTCSDCEFGEVPYTTMNKEKEFLYT
ncbi:transglutaminase-like domain-containing protein [Candidatus Woesearchaeota archaeon]|nr:transglutaminase-like domain-containing protein [Candidatus Woesearchaeota archaeon]